MNKYQVITLFPNLIDEWKKVGIISQALKKNLIEISSIDLRNFGLGEYKQVDDSPYGGGPGMVLMAEPIDNAILQNKASKNVFLTPSGQQLDENLIEEFLNFDSLNLICGRYEGFDQRVIEMHSDYEVSVGHSVVSGGEIPALYLLEALLRRIPDVLGNPDSLISETFVNNQKDFPVYTRPDIYKNHKVPDVLLSGNHKEIDDWKKNNLKDI
ncbi:MAG: tRNA (guanosine(37)-N1)-methyltransferase TrmD [Actinobacteria bacterium]|nr:tRNA (guanosine(37)-N1)-methyltransferase TrmD [Actinomycetota bacterium]